MRGSLPPRVLVWASRLRSRSRENPDRLLPGPFWFAVHDRHGWSAGSPECARDLHVDRVAAERGEPDVDRFLPKAGRGRRPDPRVLLDGRGGGRGRRRARDHRLDLSSEGKCQRRRHQRPAMVNAAYSVAAVDGPGPTLPRNDAREGPSRAYAPPRMGAPQP